MTSNADISVVVRTVGRPLLLRQCLDSLRRCVPRPTEVVVVDQSQADDVSLVVAAFSDVGARIVRSRGRGCSLALNEGFAAARADIVMVTDDDCTVAADWIAEGSRLMRATPGAIVTGRVLPAGNPLMVPSTKVNDQPRDFTGALERNAPFRLQRGELFLGNMACDRRALVDFGGFDERVAPSAEDNDLCYRWLRAGRALRYEPALAVWHHDWRTAEEMKLLYVTYAHGEGVFYAKHLRRGDRRMLRYIWADVVAALRGYARARIGGLFGRPALPADWRLGVLHGLPRGLRQGWRSFRP